MKSRKRAPKKSLKDPINTAGNESSRPTGAILEEIRSRAYDIYVKRGRLHGRELDDWLQAERELLDSLGKSHSD